MDNPSILRTQFFSIRVLCWGWRCTEVHTSSSRQRSHLCI